MSPLLPASHLFQYSIPVPRIASLPRGKGKLLDLPATCRLPSFTELDDAAHFADVRVAWNETGLGVSVEVAGKGRQAVADDLAHVEIWIDTRNTQHIHRATRFCHHFWLWPFRGTGRTGTARAEQRPIARAKEDAPVGTEPVRVASSRNADKGYLLEAWLPAGVLHGFDPDASPRLSFFYVVEDGGLRSQHLSGGPEFPVESDPSLWATLELKK